ncbi:acetyltransferase (GNAT) family protein [Mycobacterium haemophilum DSM 44634]|nr:GNAT family N-acetyltransferase [Mycobacterium haemophilum]
MCTDVGEIVDLLRDDVFGAVRESAEVGRYHAAFARIDADPNQLLLVVRDERRQLAATMQLTLIPGLARGAALRLQVEAVRVAAEFRGIGLGGAVFNWVFDYGRHAGASLVQLTTDARRAEAQQFYQRLGFEPTHIGMKLEL